MGISLLASMKSHCGGGLEGLPFGEAKVLIADWRKEYNQFRPRSSLRYKPPAHEGKMLIPLTL